MTMHFWVALKLLQDRPYVPKFWLFVASSLIAINMGSIPQQNNNRAALATALRFMFPGIVVLET
jgi:hypothetical protein